MTDIHTLVSNAEYDDTEIAATISTNTANISTNTANISTNTANIALKRNIADSYTKGEVDALLPGATHLASTLEFDAYGTSANTLSIRGGSMGILLEDSASNALADLDQFFVTFTPPVQCSNTVLVSGQLTANNISSTTITNGLANKQNTIGNNDLSIAHTSGLQANLDGKATIASLTTGLAGKQNTISDGDLTVARTSGLQSSLDSKATIASLNVGLTGKQNIIGSGDLAISDTANLQNELDDKAGQSCKCERHRNWLP